MKIGRAVFPALLILLAALTSALAQQEEYAGQPPDNESRRHAEQLLSQLAEPPGGPGMPQSFSEENQPQRRRQLEQLRLIKLLETLDLSEEQEGPFIQAFQALRRANRDLDRQREQVLRQLSEGVNEGAVGKEQVAVATRSLIDNGHRRVELHDQFIARVQALLTPEQTARLLLFQEHFEREMLERIREFRGQGGGRGGRMGNPGEPGMHRQP